MTPKVPVCKACRNATIEANAGVFRSIPYWYCRTCKFEVDDLGYEVGGWPSFDKKKDGINELEDFFSSEIDRLDRSSFSKEEEDEEYETQYDPFLKRSRRVPKGQSLSFGSTSSNDEDEDEEDDGPWDYHTGFVY